MQGIMTSFFDVLTLLEKAEIPYMVVGSIASMLYGEPRMTHDMDVVVQITPADARRLEEIFSEDQYYCPPFEVLRSEIVQRGQFNLIHLESGLKIDMVIRKATEFAINEFNRRTKVPFWEGKDVFAATPEDVILVKLEYFRQGGSEKHLKDIRGIIAETQVDFAYIEFWVHKLALSKQWSEV